MKFLIDKKCTDDGRFISDWELDKRLDILENKYSYKEKEFKNEHMEGLLTSTIRIKSLKQLKEFMDDMEVDNIIISKDSGYYVSTGDLRIVVDIEEKEYKEEPDDEYKAIDEEVMNGFIDAQIMCDFYKRSDDYDDINNERGPLFFT